MAKDKISIVADIESYVGRNGNTYSQWYVGIASDARQRLFNDHAVKEKGDAWIYIPCGTSGVARAVERYFLSQGMEGGIGGGDDSSDHVYAYKIGSHTVEQN
ncbi:MAG: hypothetical protein WAO35_20055 [Terriglobia bacterium]